LRVIKGFSQILIFKFLSFPGLSYEFSEDLYYDFPDNSVEAEGNGNGNALPPTFLSVPLDLTLNEGSRLRLPCRVDRLQGFVLLWKKGANIIAIGSLVIAEVNTVLVSQRTQPPGNRESPKHRLVVKERTPSYHCLALQMNQQTEQRRNIELGLFIWTVCVTVGIVYSV
jgi:hypothetical protein